MQRAFPVLLLLFVLTSSVPYAQQRTPPPSSNGFVEIQGIKLRLGMRKAEVAAKLSVPEVNKIDEDYWIVGSLDREAPIVQFTNDRLSFASRPWHTTYNDIGEALFGVASSFNREGYSVCGLDADTDSSPELMAHRVWLRCGDKTILLVRRSWEGKYHNALYEQLGRMRETSK